MWPKTNTQQTIASFTNYSGEGGLHQAYLGLGYKVFKELSVGANASLIWGDYTHSVLQAYNTSTTVTFNGLNSVQDAEIRTWKLDLGAQYPLKVSEKDVLILGATASIGHKVKSDASNTRFTFEQNEDLAIDTVHNAFDLPYTYGIGATWRHKDNLTVGLDFKQEMWGSCRSPQMVSVGGVPRFVSQTGAYKNRFMIAAGAEYTPDMYGRHYWQRIQYRIGANYSSPYLKINGGNGPKEYSFTAGFGLPLMNSSRITYVNVGLEWLRRSPGVTNQITENYFMMHLGVTFNEDWFRKFKIR